jgi:LPPG:FO 2-phospho-L-lactate transferase
MVVALAGGIGAAKLILGLSKLLPPDQLAVIGNTGDDIELFGLRICPDLDTITYTLCGWVNPETGWGIREDSFECLKTLRELGGPGWFNLGDRDLATHLWRTGLLAQGHSLTRVTQKICEAFEVQHRLFPMTDSYVPTYLATDQGELHLQEYLVREKCRPAIRRLNYMNMEQARPTSGVEEALSKAEGIFLCPSNPLISIGPILAVPGVRELLARSKAPVFAVTPIIGQRALKGPAAKMLADLGYPVSPTTVAEIYKDILDVFVLDERDRGLRQQIEALNLAVLTVDTVMTTLEDKIRLAGWLLEAL